MIYDIWYTYGHLEGHLDRKLELETCMDYHELVKILFFIYG